MTNETRKTEVLVEHEEKMALSQAADFLATIAQKLKEEGSFTMTYDGQPFAITPSSNVELEVKLEKRNDKMKLELELEWIEGDRGSTLTIE
ncbi:amphi-Trp domain-containing protein [Sporosarcina sp. 179-K 3D1 HS]|uniref:amphi-Trp domain-containing protein n=1 Tax=Sporosarcina sp. 179-K 3D1 HS TaxID=3232169 RepID=UPI0039A34E86